MLSLIFSGAALLLCVVFFFYFRAYLRRRTSAQMILGEFQDEVDRMVAEMNRVTDRDVALVEDRVQTLKRLLSEEDRQIEEAAKRIALYGRTLDNRSREDAVYGELGRSPRRAAISSGWTEQAGEEDESEGRRIREDRSRETRERNSYGLVGQEHEGEQGRAESADSGESRDGDARPLPRIARSREDLVPKPLSFAERVREMAALGFSAELIASKLGASISEVEVCMAMGGN